MTPSATGTLTLINAFEVPPDADAAFVAGWQRARDFLAERDGFGRTALHRALAGDAPFRFVNVARVDSPDAWRAAISDPGFPGGRMPFQAHPGLYEVAHEDGDVDGEGGAVLINPFEVAPEDDERFAAGWERARAAMAEAQGYLGTRLHRAVGPADFRWVNVARWSSPLMLARARQRHAFAEAAAGLPFPAHPALYQVVAT